MMKKIILIGKGGHSKVIKDIIFKQQRYQLVGYLDNKVDSYYESEGLFYDNLTNYHKYANEHYFNIAIGNNFVREKIFKELDIEIERFPTLIHPTASISTSATIERGTVVMPNVTINADTKIGHHVIVNSGAVVEHDNMISDYVHISPNATLAGGVMVDLKSHVAIGATVLPQITIGENCIIGAGATVISDVKTNTTVIGTPAKPKE